jgi:hypothetical protein
MKTLFYYTVVLNEYDTGGEYVDSKMIVQPTFEFAKSEKDLVFKLTRSIPEEHASNPDNIRFIIRSF